MAVDGKIKELVSANKVMVFSKSYCPYCTKAKKALDKFTQDYTVLEVRSCWSSHPQRRARVGHLALQMQSMSVYSWHCCGMCIARGSAFAMARLHQPDPGVRACTAFETARTPRCFDLGRSNSDVACCVCAQGVARSASIPSRPNLRSGLAARMLEANRSELSSRAVGATCLVGRAHRPGVVALGARLTLCLTDHSCTCSCGKQKHPTSISSRTSLPSLDLSEL